MPSQADWRTKADDMDEDYCFDETAHAQVDSNHRVSESGPSSSVDGLSPLSVSEDDDLRSRCMWHLAHDSVDQMFQDATSAIPRVLIQFWNDAKAVPTDVQECMDSWQPFDEYGFDRLLFDDDSAEDFIMSNFDRPHLDAFKRCKHPAMRSDYFRLCFIYRRGGFYVDADDVYEGVDISAWFNDGRLRIQPLCYDTTTGSMVSVADSISSHRYSSHLTYYVNNDPIIAPPSHPLIRMALERATKILLASTHDVVDIQSTTGPGNLTASLVRHALELRCAGKGQDFLLVTNWDDISVPQWPLEYRKDSRNWRIWDGNDI
jgi:hypothetical protein